MKSIDKLFNNKMAVLILLFSSLEVFSVEVELNQESILFDKLEPSRGEIRLAIGYDKNDILESSSIANFDLESRFDNAQGKLSVGGYVDFFYVGEEYSFEIPSAMLVDFSGRTWTVDYSKRLNSDEIEIDFISIIKRPLYDAYDSAFKELREWFDKFIREGFSPVEGQFNSGLEETRLLFSKHDAKKNRFPVFYINSLQKHNVGVKLGIMRANNTKGSEEYFYNLNIVIVDVANDFWKVKDKEK